MIVILRIDNIDLRVESRTGGANISFWKDAPVSTDRQQQVPDYEVFLTYDQLRQLRECI